MEDRVLRMDRMGDNATPAENIARGIGGSVATTLSLSLSSRVIPIERTYPFSVRVLRHVARFKVANSTNPPSWTS